jgi:hypothetical protein
VRSPFLNGVWSERADPDPGIVAGLLDRVAATGLPHCLQLRPGASPALSRLAEHLGMSRDQDDVPLMVLGAPRGLGRRVDGLVVSLPEVRCYAGVADGRLVTTGIGVTLGARVGILNVATPPADRHRGYGAAVTTRAVADGLAAGATWSWLQSSLPGYPVYEQLGFRAAESWQTWVSAA